MRSRSRLINILLLPLLLLCIFDTGTISAAAIDGQEPVREMETDYATQFSVDYYENGSKLLTLANGQRFLVLPEGELQPQSIEPDIVILRQPLRNIYLAATAAMCLFDALDSLDTIRLSGTKEDGWYIENSKQAMREGKIIYAGKYSEPDYELLLENQCSLAVESQMIGHASSVKDKLEELGIPVLVDMSSSEPHPLGRTEWIRFYGALLDKEEEADDLFSRPAVGQFVIDMPQIPVFVGNLFQ